MPVDYFDYTLLQKKGLLKIEEQPKEESVKVDNQGFVDFTQSTNSVSSSSQSSSSSAPADNMFGFLDNPASSSNPSTSSSIYGNSSSSTSSDNNSDVNALRLKLDDTEYKLERLIERLAKIEEKLGVI